MDTNDKSQTTNYAHGQGSMETQTTNHESRTTFRVTDPEVVESQTTSRITKTKSPNESLITNHELQIMNRE